MRIFDYSVVANWEDRLESLRNMAEPERWTYLSVPAQSSLPVLDSYVQFTFQQLHAQGKVAEIDDLCCFNTGLLTPAQEEIFGVFAVSDRFEPNRPVAHENKKWFLKLWARNGDRILNNFSDLPKMATYWTDPANLIFNPNLEVRPNVDHIIRENLNRFPVELGGQINEDGVPLDLKPSPDLEVEGDEVHQLNVDEEDHSKNLVPPLKTRIALDGAIKHSIRLAERSYRVAVPQFYRNGIQLLIPLYLRDASRPDLALTLEQHDGWYRAATVLYPDWAYRHARLLSRPNSEWLGGFRTDITP